jgi:hypothetical protein
MLVLQGIVPKPLGGQIASAVTHVMADAEKPDALRPLELAFSGGLLFAYFSPPVVLAEAFK